MVQLAARGLHAAPLQQRNYPCDDFIFDLFGLINLNETGEHAFQRQLYLCMFAQALKMKAQVESWKSKNIWGLLLWQYNEIWPTGGWGSIEYGTPTTGQVLGGRWKPLQHFLKASSFAPVAASCDTAEALALCYVRNDLPTAQELAVSVSLFHFATGASSLVSARKLSLPPGAGAMDFFCADNDANATTTTGGGGGGGRSTPCSPWDAVLGGGGNCTASTCMLNVTVADAATGRRASSNLLALGPPGRFELPPSQVSARAVAVAVGDGDSASMAVEVTATKSAVYVWLSSLAHGHFEENGFAMAAGTKTVAFVPHGAANASALASTLRVEHLQPYLPPLPPSPPSPSPRPPPPPPPPCVVAKLPSLPPSPPFCFFEKRRTALFVGGRACLVATTPSAWGVGRGGGQARKSKAPARTAVHRRCASVPLDRDRHPPPGPPPPPPPPSHGCTFKGGTDFKAGGIGGAQASATPEACCGQ